MNRRKFLRVSAAGVSASAALTSSGAAQEASRPIVISSANGLRATEKAMELLKRGADTLDAVVQGVSIVEADPDDTSVGYGGLPNELGVVQLDSSVMHGPTRGAGAVAALEGIMHPAQVAKLVMERTDHVLLVGEGALRFALAMGFKRQELLTDKSRQLWMRWKQELSPSDDWIAPEERIPPSLGPKERSELQQMLRHHGTINCNAVDAAGNISGVTTTSGLAYKIPGRVGDSPIVGAGLYVDNEVGACGSTGRGEANLKTCASFMVVEYMRQGVTPAEACLRVLKRIVDNTVEPYLLDETGRPRFEVIFYAVNKKGQYAGASIWSGTRYAAHDGRTNQLHESAYLYRREDRNRG